MPRGIKYDLAESPLISTVACRSGNMLIFYFSKPIRKDAFDRKYLDYCDRVCDVISSRYRGIYLQADELAYIDLYSRIETGERRIEIVDAFDVKRSLDVKSTIMLKAVMR
jgi:hypothetical protein